jgi:maleate cis-trans isomerase
MKYLAVIILISLVSCARKDEKMCSCLEAGDKLNDFSSKMLMKEITAEDIKKMDELKIEKSKKCIDYQTMSGEEMLKKKATCN